MLGGDRQLLAGANAAHQLAPLLRGVRLGEGERLVAAGATERDAQAVAPDAEARGLGQRPGVGAMAGGDLAGVAAPVAERHRDHGRWQSRLSEDRQAQATLAGREIDEISVLEP